ncbi:MFS transporter [Herbiconiux sp. CPCC 203407]|uniref:MFS transporter n=1 Tax=Herbiconiux oxytropis TaxID=2970915 RepID=A0AA41XCX2_9MICO|nr:MFS transporter [Herbiconiux oxytropis]MCS5723782.1 MFS transporter [Herbiconiux oxytropis]MCS5725877.1 MFS transporter [Herbiconiux oxytropis]
MVTGTRNTKNALRSGWRQEITKAQWLVLTGTMLGWGLDGFAGSLYTLVLGPAMAELLPHSGIEVAPATIGLYGGLTIALFLAGWALGGIVFGVLADYFGRTRILTIGILTYAVFTAAAAFADTWWQLGILRFIAGLGSGVEAPVGAALIAESWKNRYRARAGGVMMSGYAAGFFIAAIVFALAGGMGWRFMMALAVIPAILVWFIRRFVKEPPESADAIRERRERKHAGKRLAKDDFVLRRLFRRPLLRPTLTCTAIATGALIAFWSVSTWYPQIIREMGAAKAWSPDEIASQVALASILFNAGGIVGYAAWGFIADRIGRRPTFLLTFGLGAIAIFFLFPFQRDITTYLVVMPVLGFALFGSLSGAFIYSPEVFPTSVRASAIAFCNSVGRFFTAAGPLVAGVIAGSWFGGDLGTATAVIASIGIIGLVGVLFARETRGHALPSEDGSPHPESSPAPGVPTAPGAVADTRKA